MDLKDTKKRELYNAIEDDNLENVKAILLELKNANIIEDVIDDRDSDGEVLLHKAVKEHRFPIIKALVRAGAKNLPDDDGITPLALAREMCSKAVVAYLESSYPVGSTNEPDAVNFSKYTKTTKAPIGSVYEAFTFGNVWEAIQVLNVFYWLAANISAIKNFDDILIRILSGNILKLFLIQIKFCTSNPLSKIITAQEILSKHYKTSPFNIHNQFKNYCINKVNLLNNKDRILKFDFSGRNVFLIMYTNMEVGYSKYFELCFDHILNQILPGGGGMLKVKAFDWIVKSLLDNMDEQLKQTLSSEQQLNLVHDFLFSFRLMTKRPSLKEITRNLHNCSEAIQAWTSDEYITNVHN